jgi:outer membrane receptor for ferrienterochelin and colicin
MKGKFTFAIMILLVMVCVPASFGAETGSIRGKVLSKAGGPLPGVTITLEGPSMQGKRTAVTSEDGSFRFPIVPVGNYTVTYELMGFATLKQENVPSLLGATTPVEATMVEARFEQEVVVTAAAPLIERDTADLSTRLSTEQLDALPSGDRSFRDIAKFVPGVTGVRIDTVNGDTKNGMPSFRGEGQYGNNYLVDGLSVRDPAVKSTGAPLNYDAIEEIQIITDGFSPEFGRALGGTINVLTKSGSNEFHGEAAMQYESNVLSSKETDSVWASNNDFSKIFPYFDIGGPILKDRLWFFASYNYDKETSTYDYPKDVYNGSIDEKINDSNLFTKLTFAFDPEDTLNVSGTFRNSDDKNTGAAAGRLPDALGKTKWDDVRVRVNFKSILSDSSVLELKYGFVDRKIDDVPVSGDGGAPQMRETSTSRIWNDYDSADHQKRNLNDVSADFTHFVDDFIGKHEIKLGALYESNSSTRDLNFTGDDTEFKFDPSTYAGEPYNDIMTDGSEFYYQNGIPYRYYNYQGAKLENKTNGWGFYAQDKWAPIDNLKVMFGFRMDSQNILNDKDKKLFDFTFGETLAPRITVAYDVTKDGRNLIKLGAGRFYDVTSTALAEWGNTANPYSYAYYQWGGPGNPYTGGTYESGQEFNKEYWGRWRSYDDDGDGVVDRYVFFPQEPRFKQDPTHNPLIYSDHLKPYKKDEFLIGYERGIGNDYAAKARYIWGKTRDLIDDVNITTSVDDEDTFEIRNFDRKRRDYQAVELEFNGRPTKDFQFNLAYVWTDNKGTSPGQFELGGFGADWGSGNDVGVFGDRPRRTMGDQEYIDLYGGLGGLDGDDGWYGPLPYATDHQITANATYRFPFEIVLGAAFEWDSGYHWQKRGWQDAYGGFLTFPEGRGAREMPSLYWLDMSASKIFEVSEGMSVSARVDVFNVTNAKKPVTYDQDWTEGEDNPLFGEVLKRQDPRSARLSLTFTF